MFKKNLARDRAGYGKHDQTEYEECHSFSSARAAGRAMKNTPSATIKMPIQRRYEIVSPKKSRSKRHHDMVHGRKIIGDDQWNGLERVQPGEERYDDRENS
jgi:hypothetical protein